jgi:DNA mismatch repair protein MutS
LTELERERDALRTSASPQAELPLFVTPQLEAPPQESAALEALRKIDPNSVSPREALELLFRLKHLDGGD